MLAFVVCLALEMLSRFLLFRDSTRLTSELVDCLLVVLKKLDVICLLQCFFSVAFDPLLSLEVASESLCQAPVRLDLLSPSTDSTSVTVGKGPYEDSSAISG
jgi:hypothetical protein